MDRCPLELWTKIATFACTDGGYTGCSLSLVSRTMRSIVDPVRYHTVSIFGNQKLFAFASQLAALSVDKPPVIRHLLIADLRVHYPTYSRRRGEFIFEEWRQMQNQAEEDQANITRTIRAIVSSAAPHLHTLAIHNWQYDPIADHTFFPVLHDATLTRVPGRWCAPDAHTRFPALRRLHVLSPNSGAHDFWDSLTKFTPHLTHLRLTGITTDRDLPRFLRVLLDIPPPRRDPDEPYVWTMDEDSSFPPKSNDARQALVTASHLCALGYVCVQPAIYDSSGDRCGNPIMRHGEMLDGLWSIARGAERGEGVGKFVLLPEQKEYSADEARRDWLDAIAGGDGPWPGGSDLAGCLPPSVRAKWPEEGNAFTSQPEEVPSPPPSPGSARSPRRVPRSLSRSPIFITTERSRSRPRSRSPTIVRSFTPPGH